MRPPEAVRHAIRPRAAASPFPAATIDAFLAFFLDHPVLPPAEQMALEAYYRSYKRHFGPHMRACYAEQTRALMALVKALGRPRLLEVGSGCGTESLWAALHGADVTGIDVLPELISVAEHRKRFLEQETGAPVACTFRRQSLLALDPALRFDLVFLEQAFHHLEPRAQVVEKLAHCVRPGGRLVMVEVNGWNPFAQAWLLKLRGRKTVIAREDGPWGNERITVPLALIRLFRPHGFRTERLDYFRVLPNLRAADLVFNPRVKLPQLLKPLFTHFSLVLRKESSAP